MSLELSVTYLQSVPLPQLPLSTAGLPSQTTGVSQVPLTVMAVAHVFLIPELDRSHNTVMKGSSPSSSFISNDDPVSRRKRVTFVIDPIASYTKDLDVQVARCVAASSVTSLRFQNEQALYGLRTSLHPLDIIVSHSSPADCIRTLPSIIPWYRPISNVVSTTENTTGWKAVIPKTGQAPLPATFKLQHEMPQDHTWYVNPYFSLTPADDPEQGSQDWLQLANNTTTPVRSQQLNGSLMMTGGNSSISRQHLTNSNNNHQTPQRGDAVASSVGRPPLAAGDTVNSSVLSPIRSVNSNTINTSGLLDASTLSVAQQQQQDIAWLLPHAKKDGGASERQAAALLTLERQKNDIAATQLESVKTQLEAEKAAHRQSKMAFENETKDLKEKLKKMETDLRTFRIERVAAADNVQQLTRSLKDSENRVPLTEEEKLKQMYGPDKLTPEPMMMSRPESVGPVATSMQMSAGGPSDAEVLAALMLQKSLKPSMNNNGQMMNYNNNNSSFQSASASPFQRQQQQLSASRGGGGNQRGNYSVGKRGPSPISKRQHNAVDPNSTTNENDRSASEQKPPPSPLIIDSEINLQPPPEKPAWNNVLGDTPEVKALDPYGLTNSASAFSDKDRKEHATLVRNLLVKTTMASPMEKMGSGSQQRPPPSGYSSRSSTPDSRFDRPTTSSQNKNTSSTAGLTYKQQANRNIRSGSPRSAAGGRAQSPSGLDQSKVSATTASLHNLSNHLKAGRKLIEELRSH